ncbi:MAG: hypothetical protein V1726_07465 [Methanobacteriota archaeon]
MVETQPSTPLGYLFIAVFWILVGAMILGLTGGYSSGSSPFFLIILGISLFCIVLGWGVLSLKQWAITTSLVISLFGLFYIPYFFMMIISTISSFIFGMNRLSDPYPLIQMMLVSMIPLSFTLMALYLLKQKSQ